MYACSDRDIISDHLLRDMCWAEGTGVSNDLFSTPDCRLRAARIDDLVSTVRQLHKEFQWPLPPSGDYMLPRSGSGTVNTQSWDISHFLMGKVPSAIGNGLLCVKHAPFLDGTCTYIQAVSVLSHILLSPRSQVLTRVCHQQCPPVQNDRWHSLSRPTHKTYSEPRQ